MKSFKEIATHVATGNINEKEKFIIEANNIAYIANLISRKDREIQSLKFKLAALEIELIGSKATYEEVKYL